MNTTELLLCGHVTNRTEHVRPFWAVFAPKLVTLEIKSENGDSSKYTMLADHCFTIKVGQFVRIKRSRIPKVYSKPEANLWAFSAPSPKPHVIGRGYLLRIMRTTARVRLEDGSVVEVSNHNRRGELEEGSAVRLMAFRHGALDQYRERYVEVDETRPASTGMARDQVIGNMSTKASAKGAPTRDGDHSTNRTL